ASGVSCVCAALYILVNMIFLAVSAASVLAGMLETLVALVALGVFAHVLLALRHWPERFNQTFSALLLVGAVFTLIAAGPMLKLVPYLANGHQPPPLLVLGPLAIVVWRVAVMAHIFRHALEIRIGQAVGVVVLFELVRGLLLLMLLGLLGVSGVAAQG